MIALLATSVMHSKETQPSIGTVPGAEKKHTLPHHNLVTTGVGFVSTLVSGMAL